MLRVLPTHDDRPEPRALSDHEALLSSLGDLLFQVDAKGLILEAHCPPDYEFQLSAEGLVGQSAFDLLPDYFKKRGRECLEVALAGGGPHIFNFEYPLADRVRVFQARMSACEGGSVLALVRDVTARNQFEREILDVSQRTQHRIGQDLHDGLGQHLTGITFLGKALERKLAARQLPEAGDAAEIVRMVINVLSQTRQLARSLFPVELESGEFVAALQEMAASVEEASKIRCRLLTSPGLVVRDPDVTNHLFRLAQEAINNAVKHGAARQIELQLTLEDDQLHLCIRDDGAGFEPQRSATIGLGMRIMQYRAQKIGARLDFYSPPEGGTEVTCSVPAEKAAAVAEGSTTTQ